MSMSKSERLQVLVEPRQQAQLQRVARQRGVSVAVVVRQAIDREISGAATRRYEAGQFILDSEPIELPVDPADLEAELLGEYNENE